MDNFQEGDVVRLKSGGPGMTIKQIRDNGELFCQWFDGNNVKDDYFNPSSLEKDEETDEQLDGCQGHRLWRDFRKPSHAIIPLYQEGKADPLKILKQKAGVCKGFMVRSV